MGDLHEGKREDLQLKDTSPARGRLPAGPSAGHGEGLKAEQESQSGESQRAGYSSAFSVPHLDPLSPSKVSL